VAATFAAVNLGAAVAQYLGGRLADRAGARLVIGWTGIALGLTWIAMAATARWWAALAVCYILGNTLFGLQSTAFVTIISDSAPVERRMQAFARYQFWNAAALVAGPVLGSIWLLHLPAFTYLGATGGAYLLVGLVRLTGLRDPRPALAPPARRAADRLMHAAAGDGKRRELLLLSIGVTLAFALTVQGPFMPVTAHALDHLPLHQVELLFGFGPFGAIAASSLAPRLGGSRTAQGVGLTLLAVATAAMTVPLPLGLLVLAFLVAFAGFQVATVALSALRIELAGATGVGEVIGATSALAGIGAALGLLVAGSAGAGPALIAGALAALITAVANALAGRRRLRSAAAGCAGGDDWAQ
jgi:predicted MFS family arabinose efflux permease